MKRSTQVFLALIMLSGAFFFFSCKGKVATVGTLTVIAMTPNGVIQGGNPTQIYLATSKANLDNKIYQSTGWLDAQGSNIFRDLPPRYYWYKVDGYNDYGATDVFAGIDESVILWLNSPASSKNK